MLFRWMDREFSWLDFNKRVLDQIHRNDIPIQRRIPFIGIADNNLAEFISVRFASILKGDNHRHYVKELRERIKHQKHAIQQEFQQINRTYHLVNKPEDKELLEKFFYKKIFPILTPIAVGNNKEVPVLSEKDLNYFIKVHPKENPEDTIYRS